MLSSFEERTLEFKRDLSSPKPILKTLVAFANTAGGTLIVGRADDGSIVRIGSTSRQADEVMRAELERYRSNNSFDQMACVEASSSGLDSFKAGVSQVRNPVIAQVFHRLEIMERWGSGWQRISEACKEGGYPEPEWQEPGMCTRAVFRPYPEVRASVGVNDLIFIS